MKSKRLVLEHLEDISARVLEEYSDAIREFARGRSGVYALYRRDKLYYVGLAANLMSRLKQHLRDQHNGAWDRFSVYLTAHDEHMKELESLLLRISKPPGNTQSGRFMASENQRAALNRRIKEDRRRPKGGAAWWAGGETPEAVQDDEEQGHSGACWTGRATDPSSRDVQGLRILGNAPKGRLDRLWTPPVRYSDWRCKGDRWQLSERLAVLDVPWQEGRLGSTAEHQKVNGRTHR